MTFEEFTVKLALIQTNEHLDIEETISIKKNVVGNIPLWECTNEQFDEIMLEYRKAYKRNKFRKNDVYYSKRYVKSKHKYGHRKDWD